MGILGTMAAADDTEEHPRPRGRPALTRGAVRRARGGVDSSPPRSRIPRCGRRGAGGASPPARPGEDVGRDGTFVPTERYSDTVTCELDVVTRGLSDVLFDTGAGGDDARTTIVGPEVGVPRVTFTVVAPTAPDTTPTTSTEP